MILSGICLQVGHSRYSCLPTCKARCEHWGCNSEQQREGCYPHGGQEAREAINRYATKTIKNVISVKKEINRGLMGEHFVITAWKGVVTKGFSEDEI